MRWAIAALFVVSLTACGGSSSPPTVPSDPPNPAITFTLSSSGVSPKELRVPPGTRVLFMNSDNRQHEIGSDQHPDHTDCLEINQVGFISPGQLKETGNLVTVRTCGFHDHLNPTNTTLMGRIIIQ